MYQEYILGQNARFGFNIFWITESHKFNILLMWIIITLIAKILVIFKLLRDEHYAQCNNSTQ